MRRWLTLWLGIVLGILGLLPVAVAAATGTAKWSTTSLPNPPLRQGQLTGISCTSTSACVGSGFFQSASGNIAPMAEALTKSGWSAAAAPAPGGSVFAQLLAISCHGTDCEAVGMSSSSSGKISALAERWNGSSWSTQSVPSPKGTASTTLTGVSCTSSTACIAVGYSTKSGSDATMAAAFNGKSWALQTTPNPLSPDRLNAVSCSGSSSCVAVGSSGSGLTVSTVALQWNGSKWASIRPQNPAGSPYSELLGVSCTGTTCMAVGDSYPTGFATESSLAEQWKSGAWTILSSPDPGTYDNQLNGVSCKSASDCTAVGQFDYSGSYLGRPLAVAWNGTGMTAETVPEATGVHISSLHGVSCPTSSACVAGGTNQLTNSLGEQQVFVAALSGTTWSSPASPSPLGSESAELAGISCGAATSCETVGFATNGTTGELLAEHLSGTTWTIQSTSSLRDFVGYGVGCFGSICLAVGSDNIRGTPDAAEWNGKRWSSVKVSLPSGATEVVLSGVSCASSSNCEVVGSADIGDSNRAFAAVWTGGTSLVNKFVPTPTSSETSALFGVSCASKSWCAAVGFWDDRGHSVDLAEHWNGSSWSVVTTPNPSGGAEMQLNAVSCTSASFCEAAGQYADLEDLQHPLALGWNGHSWKVQTAPEPSRAGHSGLLGVSCTGTTCMAVGHFNATSGAEEMLAEAFRSDAWSVVGSPSEPVGVTQAPAAIACTSATNCLAVGLRGNSADGGAWATQVTYAARYS